MIGFAPAAVVPPPPASANKVGGALLDLLEPDGAKLPAFPLERLPPSWARWARETAGCAGAPADYVALGLFAAVAGVAGAGVRTKVLHNWREPLVLWQCAVGHAGSGKGAGLAAGRRLIEAIDDAPDGDADAPQRIVSDTTLRALAGVVARNPKGVVAWHDQLMGWLPGRGRARAGWQEAWSAEPVVVNRGVKAAVLRLKHLAASVIGGATPADLTRALKGAGEGLWGRFLFAWPAAAPWMVLRERTAPDDDAAVARLKRIASIVGSAATPLELRLEDDALDVFDAFCQRWHACGPQADGPFAGWLGKAGSQVARLAAALALLEWSERSDDAPPRAIGRSTLEHAIALWDDYFRPHAEATLRLALRGPREDAVRRALRWLREGGATVVSREDIRAQALARSVDARGADRVIAELEALGVLVREADGRRGRGRPPARWRVSLAGNTGNSPEGEKARQNGPSSHLGTPITGNSPKSDSPAGPWVEPKTLPPDFDLDEILRRVEAREAQRG